MVPQSRYVSRCQTCPPGQVLAIPLTVQGEFILKDKVSVRRTQREQWKSRRAVGNELLRRLRKSRPDGEGHTWKSSQQKGLSFFLERQVSSSKAPVFTVSLFSVNLYWSIVALQCCQFLLYTKVNQLFMYILGWPRSSLGFLHNILQKNLNKPFGQPSKSPVLDFLPMWVTTEH